MNEHTLMAESSGAGTAGSSAPPPEDFLAKAPGKYDNDNVTRYDWNRYGRPRVALATRIGGWFITTTAALSWPMFLYLALHDWTLIFVPLILTASSVAQRAAMRKVYGIGEVLQPAEPESGVPRDLERSYPRPEGRRRRLDSVCPVCGMDGDMVTLNGRVLGWPAHASCAEWLGNWGPPKVPPPPYVPTGSVIPERSITVSGNLTGIVSAGDSAVIVQWVRKACPGCGMEFGGPETGMAYSLSVHYESGQCEQRQRYNAGLAKAPGKKECGNA